MLLDGLIFAVLVDATTNFRADDMTLSRGIGNTQAFQACLRQGTVAAEVRELAAAAPLPSLLWSEYSLVPPYRNCQPWVARWSISPPLALKSARATNPLQSMPSSRLPPQTYPGRRPNCSRQWP